MMHVSDDSSPDVVVGPINEAYSIDNESLIGVIISTPCFRIISKLTLLICAMITIILVYVANIMIMLKRGKKFDTFNEGSEIIIGSLVMVFLEAFALLFILSLAVVGILLFGYMLLNGGKLIGGLFYFLLGSCEESIAMISQWRRNIQMVPDLETNTRDESG